MAEDEIVQEHMDNIMVRLRRVEGQMRGLQKMVEEQRPCADIVTQVSAAMGAMKRIAAIMVACSMRQAVLKAENGGKDADKELNKLMDAVAKMA